MRIRMLAAFDQQIQIRLTTTDLEYSIEQNVFSVSSSASSVELQDLVKSLLNISDESVEFNFRVCEELLQQTIGKHCESSNFSGEAILDVHYFPKRKEPDEELIVPVPDWVGGVSISPKYIYAGLYNGQLARVSIQSREVEVFEVHSKPIKSVSFVKQFEDSSGVQKDLVVTASLDQNLCYSVVGEDFTTLYTLKGHSQTVTSCSVAPSTEQIASGSWDTYLKIWSTSLDEPCDEEIKNKRKKHSGPVLRTPILTLGGHSQVITDCCWKDNTQLVTVSYDMSVKLWDTQLMSCVNTLSINSALQCVDWSEKAHLIATGSSDKFIRLFDPRGASGTIVHSTLVGHSCWVAGVKWGSSDVELVSASYDNRTLLWDIRSPKTYLSVVGTHSDKVLCVDWSAADNTVASGGADNTIHINKL